jgi:hypothetical protein
MNPHFIPKHKLKSGETPTAMLAAIRRVLWEPECEKSARANINAAIYRKASYTQNSRFNKEVAIASSTAKRVADMTDEWFPDYWLTFVLLSLPGEDHCLACFQTNTGTHTYVHTHIYTHMCTVHTHIYSYMYTHR